MTTAKLLLATLLVCAASNIASAYVAPVPQLMIVASADGSALLRIEPGIGPVHGWHNPKGIPPRPAQATVFQFDPASNVYRIRKTFALRNQVAPITAVISNGAELIVTCDDWHPEIGCTANVVVIYRGSGELVKAWSLEDIYSIAEINRFGPLPINVPTRRWRGEKVKFNTDSKGPAVWIPHGDKLPWQIDLRLDLTSLTFERYPTRQEDEKPMTSVPNSARSASP